MADVSIKEVLQKLNEIAENTKRFSDTKTSTYAEKQARYREEHESRVNQPKVENESNNKNFLKTLAESIYGKSPAELSSNEKRRYKKIGDILKPIFNTEAIVKSLHKLSDNLSESIEQQQRASLFKSVKDTVSDKKDATIKDKAPKQKSFFENIIETVGPKLLGGAALIAIGAGISYLIKGLGDIEKIDMKRVLGFSIAFGAVALGISAMLFAFNKGSSSLLKGAVAFGLVAVTLQKSVIPSLQELTNVKWDDIKGGVGALSAVLGTLIASLAVLASGGDLKALIGRGSSSWNDVIKNTLKTGVGVGAIYALTMILRHELVPGLIALSEVKWDTVSGGLAAAGLALGGMTLITAAIAAVLNDSSFAKMGKTMLAALAAGGIVYGLVQLLGELGEKMQTFAKVDWKSIESAVIGSELALGAMVGVVSILSKIMSVGGPLATLLGAGAAAATTAMVYAMTENLGYLADSMAKYKAVDADKLTAVGNSLVPFSIGLGKFLAIFGVGGIVSAASNIIDSIMGIADRDIASVIMKFESINPQKIQDVGNSLLPLAAGMKDFLLAFGISGVKTIASNVLDSIMSIFGKDVVGNIKKYESIDANKLLDVGISLKQLSEGLNQLLNVTQELKTSNNIIIRVRGDIDTNLIDTVNKLTVLSKSHTIKLEGVSELQKIIKELNTTEIDLLTEQRDILKDVRGTLHASNMHLQSIAERGMGATPASESKSYMREEKSFTRDHYLQNTGVFQFNK